MKYCNIEDIYKKFCESSGVCTDSRDIKKGCMFFAIKGDKFDGNQFALPSLEKGAWFAVVDDESLYGKDDRLLIVENTLKALQELAKMHRKKMDIPVVAITGTNGKTTTKELVSAVLSSSFNILSTTGNLNNHIGVPLTLLSLNVTHQIAVVEMGANHIGDIKELVDIALPNYGIITNIGLAHLQGFGSFEGVRKTKGELYDYLKSNDGVVFVNGDDALLMGMSKDIKRVVYSQKDLGFTRGKAIDDGSVLVKIAFKGKDEDKELVINSNLVGKYNIYNLLVAICVGQFFSVADSKIKESLEKYIPTNNRSQLIDKGTNTIISDAYNANPTSMREAINNFASIKTDKKKVVILGDMNELGTNSHDEHRKIISLVDELLPNAKKIYCGPIFSQIIQDEKNVFPSSKELTDYIKSEKINNSFILIKGSNSIKLYDIKDIF